MGLFLFQLTTKNNYIISYNLWNKIFSICQGYLFFLCRLQYWWQILASVGLSLDLPFASYFYIRKGSWPIQWLNLSLEAYFWERICTLFCSYVFRTWFIIFCESAEILSRCGILKYNLSLNMLNYIICLQEIRGLQMFKSCLF